MPRAPSKAYALYLVTSPTSSTPPTTTSQRSARATWLENTTLKVAVESLIDTHFHKTKGTDYNCATFMEEPALSKFKPAQIANVLKEFINGDNPKPWSISSNAAQTDFDNSSSWHSMYKVREPQLAALVSLAVIPLWPPLSLLTQLTLSEAACSTLPPQATP